MRTLLVNCYKGNGASRMAFYRNCCSPYSEIQEVLLTRLSLEDLRYCDAVVISGSQWMLSSEEIPRDLVDSIRGLRCPTLGICFGHQLLARAFGAEIRRGIPVERDELIEINASWPLFEGLGPACVMRESHSEFVTPETLVNIGWDIGASSVSCAVEAARHPELPLFGVQFHPERSGAPGMLLFASFYRIVKSFAAGSTAVST